MTVFYKLRINSFFRAFTCICFYENIFDISVERRRIMANTTFCELREKEIINICDGARLGCICDLEIDDSTGTICSIVVPGPSRFLGLLRNSEELVIPFCKIQKSAMM